MFGKESFCRDVFVIGHHLYLLQLSRLLPATAGSLNRATPFMIVPFALQIYLRDTQHWHNYYVRNQYGSVGSPIFLPHDLSVFWTGYTQSMGVK